MASISTVYSPLLRDLPNDRALITVVVKDSLFDLVACNLFNDASR